MATLHGNVTWMGVAKKTGDRVYDFVDSKVEYLFYVMFVRIIHN
jgi:hypothetical protein